MNTFEFLNWDSQEFGYKIGKIEINNYTDVENFIKTTIQQNKEIKLFYIFSKNKLDQISNKNCTLVDNKITFEYKIPNNYIKTPLQENSIYTNKHINTKLYELAYEAGKYSRFKTDKNFTKNEFKKLYDRWLEKIVIESNNYNIVVKPNIKNIRGFVAVKSKDKLGVIELIAVDPQYQGKGIGTELINETYKLLAIKGINFLNVATQESNTNAMKFYKKMGMKIIENVYIYHYWIK